MAVNPLYLLEPMYLMGVIKERQDFGLERPKYIGRQYFKEQNVPEQTVLWESIRDTNRLGGVYSAKGKPVPGDELSFSSHFARLVWIKAAKVLDPQIVQAVRDPGMIALYKSGGPIPFAVESVADRVATKMKANAAYIDDQIQATKEYFCLQAMQGELVWPPLDASGNVIASPMPEWNSEEKIYIKWSFTPEFKQSVANLVGVPAVPGAAARQGTNILWNKANADPRHDLEVIADLMLELKNVDAENAEIVMSRKVLSYMAELANIQRWITGVNYESVNAGMAADIVKVKEKIKTMFGYEIRLYDAKWTYTDGVDAQGKEVERSVRFLPAHKMLVVPKGENFGTLAQARHENQDGDWVFGDSVWVYTEPRAPRTREVEMDNVVFPLLQQPEGVGVFTVLGA